MNSARITNDAVKLIDNMKKHPQKERVPPIELVKAELLLALVIEMRRLNESLESPQFQEIASPPAWG